MSHPPELELWYLPHASALAVFALTRVYWPISQGALKWKAATGFADWSTPTLGPDGMVYVGSNNNLVSAVTASGSIKWTFAAPSGVHSTPAVDGEFVFIGCENGDLYKLDKNSPTPPVWNFTTSGDIFAGSPVVVGDTIYITASGVLYAVNKGDGSLKWQYNAGAGGGV